MSSTTAYTYVNSMPVHRFIERHLIRELLLALGADGWVPVRFSDGETDTKIPRGSLSRTHAAVWAAFTEVDEGALHFARNGGHSTCWVKLIGGNGEDVISDYSPPAIDAAMRRVFLQ